jgi:CRISPR-associated protein Cas6/Cse3/CasE subtype I-E
MTAILTQLTVSLRGEGGKRLARSPYRLHQMVYRAFPGDERPLFRAEPYGESDYAKILVQTKSPPPDLTSVGYILDMKYRELEPVEAGAQYFFRLSATPTRCQPEQGKRGKKVEILDDQERLAWLHRKLSGGATIEQAYILFARLRRVAKPGGYRYSFYEVVFQGTLVCQDAEKLTALRAQGIGTQKSQGAGLLSLVKFS